MARTLKQIKLEMSNRFITNESIKSFYGLTDGKTFEDQFSLVSFENILFDIVTYSIYLLELLFDQHSLEIDTKLKDQKRGRLSWYGYMALQYQQGYALVPNTDVFDNEGVGLEAIEASKIIKNASVVSGDKIGTIIIKIAGKENNELAPIPENSVLGLQEYFDEVKFAGNRVNIVNSLPDRLYLEYDIYIDPLILDLSGVSYLTGKKPVEIAINEFKTNFSFDGELVLQDLDDVIQNVKGVKIAHRKLVRSSFIVPEINDYGDPSQIVVKKVLESGYFSTPDFNGINYVV